MFNRFEVLSEAQSLNQNRLGQRQSKADQRFQETLAQLDGFLAKPDPRQFRLLQAGLLAILQLNPRHAGALTLMAYLFLLFGDQQRSAHYLGLAETHDPHHADVRRMRKIYEEQVNPQPAGLPFPGKNNPLGLQPSSLDDLLSQEEQLQRQLWQLKEQLYEMDTAPQPNTEETWQTQWQHYHGLSKTHQSIAWALQQLEEEGGTETLMQMLMQQEHLLHQQEQRLVAAQAYLALNQQLITMLGYVQGLFRDQRALLSALQANLLESYADTCDYFSAQLENLSVRQDRPASLQSRYQQLLTLSGILQDRADELL